MADEERFKELMESTAAFINIRSRFLVLTPRNPGEDVEVDNICQKNNVLYVFEGKWKTPKISQLTERFFLFQFNKSVLVKRRVLAPYNSIRVFHYSIRGNRRRIIEYNQKGEPVQTFNYSSTPELIEILKKL